MHHISFSSRRLPQRGFTLLEVVVAISIAAFMMVLLMNAFSPHLLFKQRIDSKDYLADILRATDNMYRANAFLIDDYDELSSDIDPQLAALGQITVADDGVTRRVMSTSCPAKRSAPTADTAIRDPGDIFAGPVPQVTNISSLQPYTERSVESLAKDGSNNVLCVLISRRATLVYDSYPLYYHVIAYVSAGNNNLVESDTELLETKPNGIDSVWTLSIGGDDQGVVFDGSKIAIENYNITKARLSKFARAYESYFKIRYQSRFVRDPHFNYFYASDSFANDNNGEPYVGFGDPVPIPPATMFSYVEPEIWPVTTTPTIGGWYTAAFNNVIDTGLWKILGLNDSDLVDAWNNPILIDNFSARVRAGSRGGVRQPAPFSAQFGAFLPGVLNNPNCAGDPNDANVSCPSYMTGTAISTY